MPGIHLYTGNRLELLADRFAEIIDNTPLPPFKQEIILVQSKGMARWLAMQTATRLNIWANCECPFPNSFIYKIFRLILSNIPDNSPYDKRTITFHLMDLIPQLVNNPAFKPIQAYLQENRDLSLFQLAAEVADLFDQYTLYRPDMVLDWESGVESSVPGQDWQPQLWRQLIKRLQTEEMTSGPHRAKLYDDFQRTVSSPGFDPSLLPTRVSVFGISSLPPFHLNILASLAQYIDLHFFVINPCREYWADILVDRQIVKVSRQEQLTEEFLHLQEGNSLLASMGHLGRDMIAMLQNLDCREHEFFLDPGGGNLLSNIHQDILYLYNRGPGINEPAGEEKDSQLTRKQTVDYHDTSLVLQSCHSPMREIEVLHNHLLETFNDHSGEQPLEPRDILVMTPDIEEYGPLIQAVFGSTTRGTPPIPYTIADRKIRNTSHFIETFFELLLLANSRITNVQVLSLLESKPVQLRFQIDDNDLAIIKSWIDKTGICWGIDRNHKENLNLPPFSANTWRAGLDRLLLGYAMPGKNHCIYKDILPYDDIEGSNTKLLGNFLDFTENLFNSVHMLEQQHPLQNWSAILLDLMQNFLYAGDDSEPDRQLVHQVLIDMGELQERSSFCKPIDIDIIKSYLGNEIEQQGSGLVSAANFLSGGVTFCEMLPMRAIPFKTICLLGMNDGSYPRPGRTKSFDLMFHEPRRGDRSRRLDDRYLFLEAILSTRRQLYISYVGQSIKDDSTRPPSVLVSELMDYVDQGFTIEQSSDCKERISILDHLTTKHRLQPFHPDYFKPAAADNNNKLFSYSVENFEAATVLAVAEKLSYHSVIQQPLPPPSEDFREVTLDRLCRFFANPARFFLTNRLGIAPVEQLEQLNSNEPFTIKGLHRYRLENDLLQQKLDGKDLDEFLLVKKAAGDIPHGQMGKAFYQEIISAVETFSGKLERLQGDSMLSPVPVELDINGFNIVGTLGNIYTHGMIRYRCANLKPRDNIQAWINHLVLNAVDTATTSGYEPTTFLAGKDKVYKFTPLPGSKKHLQKILMHYWHGLSEPLHFFPNSSFAFANEIFKGKNNDQALRRARAAWEGSDFIQGEKNDPYFRLCFRETEPFSRQFIDLAKELFLPLLEQQEKYNP